MDDELIELIAGFGKANRNYGYNPTTENYVLMGKSYAALVNAIPQRERDAVRAALEGLRDKMILMDYLTHDSEFDAPGEYHATVRTRGLRLVDLIEALDQLNQPEDKQE